MAVQENLPATDYAISYSSTWLDTMKEHLSHQDFNSLAHVNCSYLSTGHGKAPTLLALKRHAQSLTNLIRFIAASSKGESINSFGRDQEDEAGWCFDENEALDWLTNLDDAYENNSLDHSLPLDSLINVYEMEERPGHPRHHCPLEVRLEQARPRQQDTVRASSASPWRSPKSLARHADECLEQLDQEFSSTGGLLSMLSSDEREMRGIKNSFLGQWLLQHQSLVLRMHELEISYVKALDIAKSKVLKPWTENPVPIGEFPPQTIGIDYNGAVGIVDTKSDVLEQIHRELDKQEEKHRQGELKWLDWKASTERMLRAPEDTLVPGQLRPEQGYRFRGFVSCHLTCCFSRIVGDGHAAKLMIQPAIDLDKAYPRTREAEKRSSAYVQIPTAWPKRAPSKLEAKYEKRNKEARLAEMRYRKVKSENAKLKKKLAEQKGELEELRSAVKELESGLTDSCEEQE